MQGAFLLTPLLTGDLRGLGSRLLDFFREDVGRHRYLLRRDHVQAHAEPLASLTSEDMMDSVHKSSASRNSTGVSTSAIAENSWSDRVVINAQASNWRARSRSR
jgi:hypothetical protein